MSLRALAPDDIARNVDRKGARPLRRVIEEAVVTPLAVRIAPDPGFRERAVDVGIAAEALDISV